MSLSCLGHHLIVVKQRINESWMCSGSGLLLCSGAFPIYSNIFFQKPLELSWRFHMQLCADRAQIPGSHPHLHLILGFHTCWGHSISGEGQVSYLGLAHLITDDVTVRFGKDGACGSPCWWARASVQYPLEGSAGCSNSPHSSDAASFLLTFIPHFVVLDFYFLFS